MVTAEILHILSTRDGETKTVVAQRGEVDLLDDGLQNMDGVFDLGDLRLVDLESGSSIGISKSGISKTGISKTGIGVSSIAKTEGVASIDKGSGGGGGSSLLLISITPLPGTGNGDTGNVVASVAKAVGVAVVTGIGTEGVSGVSKTVSVVTGISRVQDGGIGLSIGITLLSGLTLGKTGDGESKGVLASGLGDSVLDCGNGHLDFLGNRLDHLRGVRVGDGVGSIEGVGRISSIGIAKELTVDSKH